MSALAAVGFDPLRDKSYQSSRLGGPIVDYLASKKILGRAGTTLDDKERYLAAFAMMWPTLEIADVDTGHCVHYLAAQPAGETRRVRRSHLNDFFRWALRWDLIARNPLDRLEQQARKKQLVYDIFSDSEIAALQSLTLVDGALMRVLFDEGLRRSDAVALQPRHIMPEPMPGQLRCIGGKGDKDRLVPLTKAASQALAELQILEGMKPTDHFWYTRPGGKRIRRSVIMGEASWHNWWVRCLKAADVRYRNPHMTRHTMATRWLRRGGRLETLSLILGHASIKTTFDLYGHLDTRDVFADLELIEG